MMLKNPFESYRLLGASLIPGPHPAGENARIDPAFEMIEAEIAKIDSLQDDVLVDWNEIVRLAAILLEQKTKDLLLVSYFIRGLCEKDLYAGMEVGFDLLKQLVEHHWDACFPPKKRVRGRVSAIQWLVERLAPLVDTHSPQHQHLSLVTATLQHVDQLSQLLADNIGEQAPAMGDVRRPLNEAKERFEVDVAAVEEKKQKQEQEREKAAEKQQPVSAQTANNDVSQEPLADGPISDEQEVSAVLRRCQEALRQVTNFRVSDKPLDESAYRINRFATWINVVQAPPDKEGVTQLRPPTKDRIAYLRGQVQGGQFQAVLPALEESFSKAPFWLDIHRMIHHCLLAMGGTDAARVVTSSLQAFLERFPTLMNLNFSDNTPFADEETQQWLALEVLVSAEPTPTSLPEGESRRPWEEALIEAKQLAKEKGFKDALALFSEGASRTSAKKDQFLWRLNQAQFCIDTKKMTLAIGILEALDKEQEHYHLGEWEPMISKHILSLLWRAYQQHDNGSEVMEKRAALQVRLYQLDVVLAYELAQVP